MKDWQEDCVAVSLSTICFGLIKSQMGVLVFGDISKVLMLQFFGLTQTYFRFGCQFFVKIGGQLLSFHNPSFFLGCVSLCVCVLLLHLARSRNQFMSDSFSNALDTNGFLCPTFILSRWEVNKDKSIILLCLNLEPINFFFFNFNHFNKKNINLFANKL